jgi:hypothetical protein
MVTGTPSSAATRRMRFFIVVGLVPSESGMRMAVVSNERTLLRRAWLEQGIHARSPGHAASLVEGYIFELDGRGLLSHGFTRFLCSRTGGRLEYQTRL